MGRRSQLPRWLGDANIGPLHEESEDSGFIYYGRYFRSADGTTPQPFGPLLAPMGTFSILTLPSDNGTWAVTARHLQRGPACSSGCATPTRGRPSSRPARCTRTGWRASRSASSRRWAVCSTATAVRCATGGRCSPASRCWATPGRARTPRSVAGYRSGCCTRSACARWSSSHLEDPLEFAQAWDAATEAKLTPWYRETVEEDRDRLREIDALRDGLEPAPPSERSAVLRERCNTAVMHDPDLFRAFLESRAVLTPLSETFARGRRGRANPRAGGRK